MPVALLSRPVVFRFFRVNLVTHFMEGRERRRGRNACWAVAWLLRLVVAFGAGLGWVGPSGLAQRAVTGAFDAGNCNTCGRGRICCCFRCRNRMGWALRSNAACFRCCLRRREIVIRAEGGWICCCFRHRADLIPTGAELFRRKKKKLGK